jgi:hypothetical protein
MLKLNTLSGFGSGAAGGAGGAAYGYFGGGQSSGGYSNNTDRMTFATSVMAAHTDANMVQAVEGACGCSDTITYGYWSGGYSGGSPPNVDTGNRLTFATGTAAAHTDADLTTAEGNMEGGSDGVTYGYFGGAGPEYVANRITFSTGVNALHTDSTPSVLNYDACFVPDPNVGGYIYQQGGYDSGASDISNRITISTGVNAAHTDGNMSTTTITTQGFSDLVAYGYTTRSNGTGVDRITFSTGVNAATTDTVWSATKNTSGQNSDGVTYGYMIGHGGTAATADDCDRLTYSTGVSAAFTDGDFTYKRGHSSGFSDGNV